MCPVREQKVLSNLSNSQCVFDGKVGIRTGFLLWEICQSLGVGGQGQGPSQAYARELRSKDGTGPDPG